MNWTLTKKVPSFHVLLATYDLFFRSFLLLYILMVSVVVVVLSLEVTLSSKIVIPWGSFSPVAMSPTPPTHPEHLAVTHKSDVP